MAQVSRQSVDLHPQVIEKEIHLGQAGLSRVKKIGWGAEDNGSNHFVLGFCHTLFGGLGEILAHEHRQSELGGLFLTLLSPDRRHMYDLAPSLGELASNGDLLLNSKMPENVRIRHLHAQE